ncbi:MAG: ATP-binding protein [Tissierellia bacterium]|nr:ATP-binding protein [Tissierellia bacterium]MDD4436907.1 ATP-binding protein [Tissierellia bacterium]
MGINEKYNLEFKESISRTFLKTVSAYSNYNDGKIIFGINDDGKIVGIDNVKEDCIRIENMINDSIDPIPRFHINVKETDGKNTIVLTVKRGKDTPYYYNKKAYKRTDTSTIEVDRVELRRLSLQGVNMAYEERRAFSQDLEFSIFESKLMEKIGIEKLTVDILKTLNLIDKDGNYNIAAELLADENNINFSGIDLVRFGKNLNQILYRETIDKVSILNQYDKSIEIFERYYQYEEIEGYKRIKKELIPREAFREALANAIVHRVWDINSYIQIAMFNDRIEINSPGGLPDGISKEEYLYRNISLLRNPIIAGAFYRLDFIEKFGTGIMRINEEYTDSIVKPSYDISDNYIRIILPVIDVEGTDLSEDESVVLEIFKDEIEISRAELDEKTEFNKTKSLRIINSLIDKNIIKKEGSGPGVTYRLK